LGFRRWPFRTCLDRFDPLFSSPQFAVRIKNSDRGVVQSIVNSPNSTQVAKIEERTIYREPATNLLDHMSNKLASLKKRYDRQTPSIRIDAESGSSARFKVADIVGRCLASQGLGDFARGVASYGVGPGAPMTLWFGGENS